jgi:hypothetical protein
MFSLFTLMHCFSVSLIMHVLPVPAALPTCSQLAALRKECSAALQVVVDVGLGRWVKLLAARSAANMRLKQYELRQLLDLSEQVGWGPSSERLQHGEEKGVKACNVAQELAEVAEAYAWHWRCIGTL